MQKNTKQSNKQSRISVQSTLIMFFLLALLVSGCAGMKERVHYKEHSAERIRIVTGRIGEGKSSCPFSYSQSKNQRFFRELIISY